MNKVFLVCCILTVFTGCIKIELAPTCLNPPHAPSINVAGPINVVAGSSFTNYIVSPDSALTYKWIGPSGYSYTTKNLINTPSTSSGYGQWGVVAQSSYSCTSDTTRFTVNLTLNPCTGLDTFKLPGVGTFRMNSVGGIQTTDSGYIMQYKSTNNLGRLYIYFPSKPAAGKIYSVTYGINDVSYLSACFITFATNNINYNSTGQGTVSVSVTNSQTKISFCSLLLESNFTYNDYYASSYLTGN